MAKSVEVEIPEDVSEELSEASRIFGVRKEKMIDRAILLYLDSIRKELSLKKEFNQWDELSDEALLNFEKSLD